MYPADCDVMIAPDKIGVDKDSDPIGLMLFSEYNFMKSSFRSLYKFICRLYEVIYELIISEICQKVTKNIKIYR